MLLSAETLNYLLHNNFCGTNTRSEAITKLKKGTEKSKETFLRDVLNADVTQQELLRTNSNGYVARNRRKPCTFMYHNSVGVIVRPPPPNHFFITDAHGNNTVLPLKYLPFREDLQFIERNYHKIRKIIKLCDKILRTERTEATSFMQTTSSNHLSLLPVDIDSSYIQQVINRSVVPSGLDSASPESDEGMLLIEKRLDFDVWLCGVLTYLRHYLICGSLMEYRSYSNNDCNSRHFLDDIRCSIRRTCRYGPKSELSVDIDPLNFNSIHGNREALPNVDSTGHRAATVIISKSEKREKLTAPKSDHDHHTDNSHFNYVKSINSYQLENVLSDGPPLTPQESKQQVLTESLFICPSTEENVVDETKNLFLLPPIVKSNLFKRPNLNGSVSRYRHITTQSLNNPETLTRSKSCDRKLAKSLKSIKYNTSASSPQLLNSKSSINVSNANNMFIHHKSGNFTNQVNVLRQEYQKAKIGLKQLESQINEDITWTHQNCDRELITIGLSSRSKDRCRSIALERLSHLFETQFTRLKFKALLKWKNVASFNKMLDISKVYLKIKASIILIQTLSNAHKKQLNKCFLPWYNYVQAELKAQRNAAAAIICQLVRGFLGRTRAVRARKDLSAIRIQSVVRRFLARGTLRSLKRLKTLDIAAMHIQAVVRIYLNIKRARLEVKYKRENEAAVSIQKYTRRFIVKRLYRRMRERRSTEVLEAKKRRKERLIVRKLIEQRRKEDEERIKIRLKKKTVEKDTILRKLHSRQLEEKARQKELAITSEARIAELKRQIDEQLDEAKQLSRNGTGTMPGQDETLLTLNGDAPPRLVSGCAEELLHLIGPSFDDSVSTLSGLELGIHDSLTESSCSQILQTGLQRGHFEIMTDSICNYLNDRVGYDSIQTQSLSHSSNVLSDNTQPLIPRSRDSGASSHSRSRSTSSVRAHRLSLHSRQFLRRINAEMLIEKVIPEAVSRAMSRILGGDVLISMNTFYDGSSGVGTGHGENFQFNQGDSDWLSLSLSPPSSRASQRPTSVVTRIEFQTPLQVDNVYADTMTPSLIQKGTCVEPLDSTMSSVDESLYTTKSSGLAPLETITEVGSANDSCSARAHQPAHQLEAEIQLLIKNEADSQANFHLFDDDISHFIDGLLAECLYENSLESVLEIELAKQLQQHQLKVNYTPPSEIEQETNDSLSAADDSALQKRMQEQEQEQEQEQGQEQEIDLVSENQGSPEYAVCDTYPGDITPVESGGNTIMYPENNLEFATDLEGHYSLTGGEIVLVAEENVEREGALSSFATDFEQEDAMDSESELDMMSAVSSSSSIDSICSVSKPIESNTNGLYTAEKTMPQLLLAPRMIYNGEEWCQLFDESHKAYYWYALKSHVAQWHQPGTDSFRALSTGESGYESGGALTDYSTDNYYNDLSDDDEGDQGNDGWQEYWDEQAQAKYWYNNNTGEATWTRPAGVTAFYGRSVGRRKVSRDGNHSDGDDDIEDSAVDDWVFYVDEATGQKYWYNVKTGQTSWA